MTTNPVGAKLRNTRIERGHSVAMAAREAGVGITFWRTLEAADHHPPLPRIPKAHAVATYLGTSIAELWPKVLDHPRVDQ